MRTYSAYFSTTSTNNPPIDQGNGRNNYSWNVNWRKIFGNRVGECRVRANVISQSSQLLLENLHENGGTFDGYTVGSVRLNFMSNTSDTLNGLNIGMIRPKPDPTSITTDGLPHCTLELDTVCSAGLSMVIPNFMNQSSTFNVKILDETEFLMFRVPDYQIWLYFDVDDEIPIQHNVEQCPVSFF